MREAHRVSSKMRNEAMCMSCAMFVAGANLKNTNMSFANMEGSNLTDSVCMQAPHSHMHA